MSNPHAKNLVKAFKHIDDMVADSTAGTDEVHEKGNYLDKINLLKHVVLNSDDSDWYQYLGMYVGYVMHLENSCDVLKLSPLEVINYITEELEKE